MWPICLAFGDVDRFQQFYQDHFDLALFPPYVLVQLDDVNFTMKYRFSVLFL